MIILRLLTIVLLLLPAFSYADSQEEMHLQSAFSYAKKRDWGDAVAHAKAARSDILAKYFIWEYLKDPESEATFKEISWFIKENPEWPGQEHLIRRAEAALLSEMPSDEVLDKWYAEHPPKTTLGKKRLTKDKGQLQELIREAWINDDYTRTAESRMLQNYRNVLRQEDHAKRIDRLLWEGKEEAAKRLLAQVPLKKKLFEARLALMHGSSRALKDVAKVPESQRNDAGLLFERIRWRARKGDKEGVRELLQAAPAQVPYPEKWWPYRERHIREVLGEGNVALAEKLLARHGQREDSVQAKEAAWLKGWIALEFRKKPKTAYEIFEKLFDSMETPGSKARTAYWAGRASDSVNGTESWYREAAKYNTTFYGQLALVELDENPVLKIDSDDSEPSESDRKAFKSRELVRLVYELAKAKQSDTAGKFIMYMVENARSAKEAVLAARLGRDINRIDIGVRASKKALRDGAVTLDSGYPLIKVAETAGLNKAYVLGLMRQESEFFADAVSSSGALGLMQLLPSTAKEVARKNGIHYSMQRLFDPDYNIGLGSRYLANLVERFGGSYVFATAGYNAGPGRVRQWLSQFGAPQGNVRSVVNWIEGIPFSETRNYVQHVLSNMQVYRYMQAGKKSTSLTLAHDLTSGISQWQVSR